MVPTIYVGLAISSRYDDYLAKATFDNITVTGDAPVPAMASAVINDGLPQRSMVKSLTLNFNTPVNIAAGGLTLQQRQADGSYALSTAPYTLTPATTAGPSSAYTLTFTGAGGSIADGAYRVVLNAASITNANNTAMAAAASYDFKRLFGDLDGDGGVSINDFNAFSNAFGLGLGTAGYNAAFDADGDNGISIDDFNAFTSRFGLTI